MLKEIVESIEYDEWIEISTAINKEVDDSEIALTKYDREASGLIPEKTRTSSAYKKDKSTFDQAFKKLQNFNKNSSKAFVKKQTQERRKNRYNIK